MHTNDSDESHFVKVFIFTILVALLSMTVGALLFLSSCQFVPQIAKDVEDYAIDTAVKIEVSKETFDKNSDLDLSLKVNNKNKE